MQNALSFFFDNVLFTARFDLTPIALNAIEGFLDRNIVIVSKDHIYIQPTKIYSTKAGLCKLPLETRANVFDFAHPELVEGFLNPLASNN